MGHLQEELRALQTRLHYIERREREREEEFAKELCTLRRMLEETRAAAAAAEDRARRECAQLQHEWREAHQVEVQSKKLEEIAAVQSKKLKEIAAAQSKKLEELSASRRAAAEAHAQWAAGHAVAEAQLRALVEETCGGITNAIAAERRAREEDMRRIECLLTPRTLNTKE